MAADFIAVTKINRPQMGNQLIRLANLLREVRDLSDALNDGGNHMWTGADYSQFESQFGVTGGANVLTLMGLVNNILNTDTDVTGANRLSQLDEFVARLAGQ
jgi:hypothetical protein